MKSAVIHWPQGQWSGVRARYCAPVHSCAVKWSRETKGKTSVARLFTSRHQASFKMGLIASRCSWSWFMVLTSISWCPVCCRDMFHKDLSTATESTATLSTVRIMMYFTKTKRSHFRFAPPSTPEKRRQDRFKALPTPGPKSVAGLVPVVAWGIVTGLTNWTVHQWQFSSIRSPFSLASSRCMPPLSCCFRLLLKFSALRKFTTTGAGYGLLTTSNPVGSIVFV